MKQLLLFAAFIIPTFCKAQTDSSKIEQYCEVVATERLFSNRVTIDVDYGEARHYIGNYTLRDSAGNAVIFNNVIDALNYLGQQHWILVNAFPVTGSSSGAVYHFFFKKLFDKSQYKN